MATFDVLLPVKNCKAYLEQAMQSIINQSFRDWRLLVLDHTSDDGSYEIACSVAQKDSRIKVLRFDARLSLSDITNAGLSLTDGKYVLRQDADDVSLPHRMDMLKQVFEQQPDIVCLGSGAQVIDAMGKVVGPLDIPVGEGAVASLALFRIPIAHPTVAFRLDAFNRLGAQYGTDFLGALPKDQQLVVPRLAEDYYLFGQLALVCRCENLRDVLVQYRWHGNNASIRNEMAQLEMALSISRNLAANFSSLHGLSSFDPAPFCNHGERLVDLGERTDFRKEFTELQHALKRGFTPSAALDRELAYRAVLANRSLPILASRYGDFVGRYGKRRSEWYAVKSWMLRKLRRKPLLRAEISLESMRHPVPVSAQNE